MPTPIYRQDVPEGSKIRPAPKSYFEGALTTAAAAASKVLRPLVLPTVIAALRLRVRRARSIDDLLDLAFEFKLAGIDFRPWQVRSEIRALLEAVAATAPRTVLEIGTSNGGSLFLFARIAAPDALLVSVDLPHGQFGGGYPRWRGLLYRSFSLRAQRVRLFRADSHDESTLRRVKDVLGARKVDFLFIDGDHSYDGAKRDFEMYAPLVRSGGLIAFHDIVSPVADGGGRTAPPGVTYAGGDVPQLWAEVKQERHVREFVSDWTSGSFGIGLVRKDEWPVLSP